MINDSEFTVSRVIYKRSIIEVNHGMMDFIMLYPSCIAPKENVKQSMFVQYVHDP